MSLYQELLDEAENGHSDNNRDVCLRAAAKVAEWEGHLRAADAVAKEIDTLVTDKKIDSRSCLADARLNYGQPFEYAHTKAAKATSDWWVYSTAMAPRVLMVECRATGRRGYVENPTKEEWSDAFYAPSKPYRWTDASRVIVDGSTASPFSAATKQAAMDKALGCQGDLSAGGPGDE